MEALVIKGDKRAIIILNDEQIAAIDKQQDPYIQACLKMGETPRQPLTDRSNRRLVGEDYAHRLEMCIEAKNAIEQPDGTFKRWEQVYDGVERHYYPLFKKDSSGPGWSYYDYGDWRTRTSVGPRREYRSFDLMKEGAEEFKEYYEGVFNN
jgi:hypothetical protein